MALDPGIVDEHVNIFALPVERLKAIRDGLIGIDINARIESEGLRPMRVCPVPMP